MLFGLRRLDGARAAKYRLGKNLSVMSRPASQETENGRLLHMKIANLTGEASDVFLASRHRM